MQDKITVFTSLKAPLKDVWNCWTLPEHITKWNFASDDWECPEAHNDLRTGGGFSTIMAAKDGSVSFEFGGTYTYVETYRKLAYSMEDGRQVEVLFEEIEPEITKVTEIFDPEQENTVEMQREGWQSIMDNFREYVESTENK